MSLRDRLTAHLWVGGQPLPPEYLNLILCRDVYHCRPSELRQERLTDVLPHLTCLHVENRVHSARSGSKGAGRL